jgi:hypothetical protein
MTIKENRFHKKGTNQILKREEIKINDFQKSITKTWNSGLGGSCTMIVPKKISKRYGLDTPSHILIEEKTDGIMIKKIEV